MTQADIAIHGGGYVGLTAALHWAQAGRNVLVYDPDPEVCRAINAGTPKAGEFLGYLAETPEAFTRIRATTDRAPALLRPVHVVAVPSERDGVPYMSIVLDTLTALLAGGGFGMTVLVESTLTPGTIDGFLADLRAGVAGKDFFLAVCPRRDWFADPTKNLRTLPRIVGGVTPACTKRAVELLSAISEHLLPTTHQVAELTKPLENALLHVPVMLAHELALAYPEQDVAEALRLAGTHWRLTPLYLNFGTGGRCVPLGTKYLVAGARARGESMSIAVVATETEERLRRMIAKRAVGWAGGRGILVLGVAYRPGFRDAGSAPGRDIARLLVARGAAVGVHDPMWTDAELGALTHGAGVGRLAELLPSAAVILLATPHAMYLDLPVNGQKDALWRPGQRVLDAQGAWSDPASQEVFRNAGVHYRQVGRPGWSRSTWGEEVPNG